MRSAIAHAPGAGKPRPVPGKGLLWVRVKDLRAKIRVSNTG